jgi:hypothetical protein
MTNSLHLDFIDPNQLHELIKLSSKHPGDPVYYNGPIIKGYPAIGKSGKDEWLVVRRHLEAFQTSAILKVQFKLDCVIIETRNSIYELRPVEGPRLDEREG